MSANFIADKIRAEHVALMNEPDAFCYACRQMVLDGSAEFLPLLIRTAMDVADKRECEGLSVQEIVGKALRSFTDPLPVPHPRIAAMFDLTAHLRRQIDFSLATFGPGERTAGVLDHIRKELNEVEQSPGDLEEWIDVVILAFDGAWRSGFTPDQITAALAKKQAKNESRSWPDWRTAQPGKAIEHIRTVDESHE